VQGDDAAVDRVLHALSRDRPYIVLRDCGRPIPSLCSNVVQRQIKLFRKFGALPGCSTTARDAVSEARTLGHVQLGEISLNLSIRTYLSGTVPSRRVQQPATILTKTKALSSFLRSTKLPHTAPARFSGGAQLR